MDMSTPAVLLEPTTKYIYSPAIPSLPSTTPELVATLEKEASALLVAPKMKNKRSQNTPANRNIVIASLDAPTLSAAVPAVETKSFAAIEAKLYAQEVRNRKLFHSVLGRLQPKARSRSLLLASAKIKKVGGKQCFNVASESGDASFY